MGASEGIGFDNNFKQPMTKEELEKKEREEIENIKKKLKE